MTRKHFNAIARFVNSVHLNGGSCSASYMAEHLADICAEANPNFDRARFIAACLAGR